MHIHMLQKFGTVLICPFTFQAMSEREGPPFHESSAFFRLVPLGFAVRLGGFSRGSTRHQQSTKGVLSYLGLGMSLLLGGVLFRLA